MLYKSVPLRTVPIVPLRAATGRAISTWSSNLGSRTQPNAEDYEISQILDFKPTSTHRVITKHQTQRKGVPYNGT